MAKSQLFVSQREFEGELNKTGIPRQEAKKFAEHVFYSLTYHDKTKLISRNDSELILNSVKKSSLEVVRTIIRHSLQIITDSPSMRQYKRTYEDDASANKANMRFVLKNFAETLGKISGKTIGKFRFALGQSVEDGNMLAINLIEGTEKFPIARLNLGFRFTKNGKPVLVIGNFQGSINRKEIEEFSKTLTKLGLRKKATSAFRFMAETLVSAASDNIKVEARNPRTLPYMTPSENVVMNRLVENKKLLKGMPKNKKSIGKIRLVDPKKRTPEENSIIAREKQRIATAGFRMHRAVFDQLGFRYKTGRRGKKKSGILTLKRKPKHH
ncbi:MAG: hypothetical protein ABH986_00800 [archaeon]